MNMTIIEVIGWNEVNQFQQSPASLKLTRDDPSVLKLRVLQAEWSSILPTELTWLD